ncbi:MULTISPECIES: Trm112 family protein [Ferrovum]|jgi:uncharacterized protein YbaR (Trm112 family)|uniref:UPF0434 protein FEMY_12890 n=2 Tax=root TaxID=1 RepID=A0A859A8K2_9PROT|nr:MULTISPECIES: Trm112 family protein [Ferrovum]KXW58166.1 hypothetical protein FEMY_12890 [Ferrovum myxofaciens]MBU6993576.1 Trm112 family protein [Ferrovum myxofaciens]NDU89792.1 Trm112 family protein [Ferrovum sp.]QKE37506.1 MAG: Trm112 family protein [Ferrovum myxofaciens]QKE40071.1 MAG: Trm112 family protein [Ferrovum myxofaciens]
MDSRLLEILVCPLCKGPLLHRPSRHELVCSPCRLAYPVRDGIPVMMETEARRLAEDENP